CRARQLLLRASALLPALARGRWWRRVRHSAGVEALLSRRQPPLEVAYCGPQSVGLDLSLVKFPFCRRRAPTRPGIFFAGHRLIRLMVRPAVTRLPPALLWQREVTPSAGC